VTWKRNPILTFVEDHSPGIHDTILPNCDKYRHIWEGDIPGRRNTCGDNVIRAFDDIDLVAPEPLPQPFNLWMNTPIRLAHEDQRQDGRIDYQPTQCTPGDYALFRAEMDCIAIISACPCDLLTDAEISENNIIVENLVNIHGASGPREVHYQVF